MQRVEGEHDSKAIFDRLADEYQRYDDAPIQQRVKDHVFRALGDRLSPGASILDVGSGPGTYSLPLARRGYRVTAVDISPRMLDRLSQDASSAGLAIETQCLDARMPLSTLRTHDAAISIQGPLSYDRDPLPIISNIVDRVRPGGLVILTLGRAASLEQIVRNPLRSLQPLLRSPSRASGELAGSQIVVYFHDASRFSKRLSTQLERIEFRAIGLSKYLAPVLDDLLGKQRGLRRLGATSFFVGRVPPST